MKKSVCTLLGNALLALVCLPAWSLDWKLPVVTMRYEAAGGGSEDAEDDSFEPSSLRNTVTLRVKEEADPAAFGLGLTMSAKDYYQQSGDYSYLKVEHDASVRLGKPWKLGYVLGAKWMEYPQLGSNGLPKDALTLSAATSAVVRLGRGTSLETGVAGRFALTEDPADALQAYMASAGFSTRLGDWLLAARYRGELRIPLGGASDRGLDMYHTGSVSLQWDPN
jgi:opacity protein-like surface antigen